MNGFLLSGCPGCHLGEQEVILNTPSCRLSCKNKSIKRKSCIEEHTPFCVLLLVSILNSCLEYRLNEVSCAYLHFLYFCRKRLLNIRVLVSSTDRPVDIRARVHLSASRTRGTLLLRSPEWKFLNSNAMNPKSYG